MDEDKILITFIMGTRPEIIKQKVFKIIGSLKSGLFDWTTFRNGR